eukprot:g45751.t1
MPGKSPLGRKRKGKPKSGKMSQQAICRRDSSRKAKKQKLDKAAFVREQREQDSQYGQGTGIEPQHFG